jgi:FkbM family methyltransferase
MGNLLLKILRLRKVLLGRDLYLWRQFKPATQKMGEGYGAWHILPENLSKDSIVYSFGVGTDISFDLDMILTYQLKIHAFDPTPRSIAWVKNQNLPNSFSLFEYGLANFDGNTYFELPENETHISGKISSENRNKRISVPVKKLSTIAHELGHSHIDVLKMDIEGAEYDVIEDILQSSLQIDQILIEFHHRFKEIGIAKTEKAVKQLYNAGYKIFHVSASGEEVSFIKQ